MRELNLGNISIYRDWGWAPEYVEAMWLMLQQEKPEDFVIATGHTHKLEDFVSATFDHLGLNWQHHVHCNTGLLRPTDIMINRADPTKAKEKLGWQACYTMWDMSKLMVEAEMSGDRIYIKI